MFKKTLALFLLILLAGRISIAEDDKYLFTSVKTGDVAPYAGYLLKHETMVKIYTDMEETERRLKLQCSSKVEQIVLDYKKVSESKDMQRRELVTRYDGLLKQKRDLLEDKQKEINKLNNQLSYDQYWIVGAFVLGSGLAYGITYLVLGSK